MKRLKRWMLPVALVLNNLSAMSESSAGSSPLLNQTSLIENGDQREGDLQFADR